MLRDDATRRSFTTSEIADYFGVTADAVLKWIKAGKLRAFSTPGGHRRISAQDFRDFLDLQDIPIDESFFCDPSRPRTVLVVDDEPDIRQLVRRFLGAIDPKIRVAEAVDGYDAGIKIGNLVPDLVVLDVVMPRIDGISLCRSLRGNPITRNVRVLAIIGYADRDHVQRMYTAGADLCLTKPFQEAQFRLYAERLLREAARVDRRLGSRRAGNG